MTVVISPTKIENYTTNFIKILQKVFWESLLLEPRDCKFKLWLGYQLILEILEGKLKYIHENH